jgi:hypothetical protein
VCAVEWGCAVLGADWDVGLGIALTFVVLKTSARHDSASNWHQVCRSVDWSKEHVHKHDGAMRECRDRAKHGQE